MEANPSLGTIGVPGNTVYNVDYLGTARAARVSGQPSVGFGPTIPGVTVTVHNYVQGSSTLVGPDATHKHLELAVAGYSKIPLALATTAGGVANPDIGVWDPAVACVAMTVKMGSADDGPVGDDGMGEQQNCPSATPTVSLTSTATATSSATSSGTTTSTQTATSTASGTATATPSGTATATSSGTASGTATATQTGTATASGTASGTATATSSETSTGSATGTTSGTATATASGTATATSSGTQTATGTSTSSGTGSGVWARRCPSV